MASKPKRIIFAPPLDCHRYPRYNNAMNLHEEPLSESKFSLTQHRVTPEELTRALAALETRKQEAARRQEAEQAYLERTISVDEAVRELNLEATPEEIWAEVEAQRAAEPIEETAPEGFKEKEEVNTFLPNLSRPYSQVFPSPVSSQRRKWLLWQTASALFATSMIGLAVSFSHLHDSFPPLSASTPFSHTASFSFNVETFPNGVPFQLSGTSVDRILHGDDQAQIHVDPNQTVSVNPNPHFWTLIKYEGHVYLRGWIAAPPTKDTLQGSTVDIDSVAVVPENGDRPAEVTLRLDTLHFCSHYSRTLAVGDSDSQFATMDEKITLSNVHLDQHAWERAGYVMSTKEPTLDLPPPLVERWRNAPKPSPSFQRYETGFTAASYPDEKPFLLDDDQVSYVMTASSPGTMYIDSSSADLAHPEHVAKWLAIKHDGQVYLRGWVAGDLDQTASASHVVHLYNAPSPPELGGTAKQISVPMASAQYRPYGRFYLKDWYSGPGKGFDNTDFIEQVVLSDVHLDDHAWEKW